MKWRIKRKLHTIVMLLNLLPLHESNELNDKNINIIRGITFSSNSDLNNYREKYQLWKLCSVGYWNLETYHTKVKKSYQSINMVAGQPLYKNVIVRKTNGYDKDYQDIFDCII